MAQSPIEMMIDGLASDIMCTIPNAPHLYIPLSKVRVR